MKSMQPIMMSCFEVKAYPEWDYANSKVRPIWNTLSTYKLWLIKHTYDTMEYHSIVKIRKLT